MYAFLFDKRSLGLFLWGLAVVGLALFLAGTLFGVRMDLPPPAVTGVPIAFEPLSSSPVAALADSRGGAADVRQGPTGPPASGAGAAASGGDEPGVAATEPAAAAREAPPVTTVTGDEDLPHVAPPPSATAIESAGAPPQAGPERGIALSPTRELRPRGSADAGAGDAGTGSAAAVGAARSPPMALARPDPAPVAGAAADGPRTPIRYSVQVGAYGARKNASAMEQKLRDKGYEVFVHTLRRDGQEDLLAVRFGSYPDPETARAAAEEFHREEGTLALVRPADTPL